MNMYETTQPVEKYLDVPLECSCGRTHYAPIRAVNISQDAILSLPEYMSRFRHKTPYLICDPVTWKIVGQRCSEILQNAGYPVHSLILKHLEYDEATLGEIVLNKPDDCDVMIGCGTGSITDMLRFSSFKLGVPCFTVATGAPMDGFSASVGIMNVNKVKRTMPAHSSEVIIGDTNVLKGAPFRMTIAGFGDLIGKINSLNDWKLGHIVTGEHYCGAISTMVSDYVSDLMGRAREIRDRDPKAVGDLLNALLLTGLTISLYGSSRAISGAEHHMSHYWEIVGAQQQKQFAMHGEQVAVGTVLTLCLAEELRARTVDFSLAREKARSFDPEKWKAEIRRAYGDAAEEIISLQDSARRDLPENRLKRIDSVEKNREEIRRLLEQLPSASRLTELLKDVGSPAEPSDIGINREILRDTLIYSRETRCIYTIFQLIADLGLSEELADAVVRRFFP